MRGAGTNWAEVGEAAMTLQSYSFSRPAAATAGTWLKETEAGCRPKGKFAR